MVKLEAEFEAEAEAEFEITNTHAGSIFLKTLCCTFSPDCAKQVIFSLVYEKLSPNIGS